MHDVVSGLEYFIEKVEQGGYSTAYFWLEDARNDLEAAIEIATDESENRKKIRDMKRLLLRIKALLPEAKKELGKLEKEAQGILSFWQSICGREYEARQDCDTGYALSA